MVYILALIFSSIVFILTDYLWIQYVVTDLYIKEVPSILNIIEGDHIVVRIVPAIFVYVLLIGGLNALLFLMPTVNKIKFFSIAIIFGLATYGVYGFTLYALVPVWTFKLALFDAVWGMAICFIAAIPTYLCIRD